MQGVLRSLRPRRWDAISAAVVLFLVLPEVLVRRSGAAGVAFNLALAIPLLWRSRWPSPVLMATAGIAFVQWIAGERVLGDVALLVALYTVASRESARTALVAAGILELGVVLALPVAVLAAPSCDIGLVGYEMALLVSRAKAVLTPALRQELQGTLPR